MRATDAAYRQLRDEIVGWRLEPGTLLSEVELALRLGTSRTPLRAALARLALEGLVDTSRGRTGVVAEVSPAGIRDLFELREAVEIQAARLASRRRDPQVFADLALEFDSAAILLAEGGVEDYYAVVARFDAAFDAAVGNEALSGALDTVRIHLQRARRMAADDEARLLRAADEHRSICTAIRDGDAELAAAATTVHLRNSLSTILRKLNDRAGTTREAAQ